MAVWFSPQLQGLGTFCLKPEIHIQIKPAIACTVKTSHSHSIVPASLFLLPEASSKTGLWKENL